jgi:hypothetical protein
MWKDANANPANLVPTFAELAELAFAFEVFAPFFRDRTLPGNSHLMVFSASHAYCALMP